jgi:hypothetical protein
MRIGLCCGAVVERTLGLDLHDPSSDGHLSSFRPKKNGRAVHAVTPTINPCAVQARYLPHPFFTPPLAHAELTRPC